MENKKNPDSLFTFERVDESVSEEITAPRYSYWGSVARTFFSSKVAILMLLILGFVIVMSIIHPMISGYDNLDIKHINNRSQWFLRPSFAHPFGTDDVGRDMFAAVWAGARNSLFIAFMATAITSVLGIVVGMIWGFSKKIDVVMIEVYNVISNVPYMLVVMILSYTLGAGVWQLIFALSLTSWVGVAYFIRVQVMIIRDREYNLASRTLGTSTWKMITHNVFPYLISVIVTNISRSIPSFISYEVFLGYIGVGLTQKTTSLGRIVQENAKHMASAPYLFVIPVFITALISVSMYIVGQTLADASDPRNHMI